MTRIINIFYRPTENHVGVIYSRWGKFKRFAHPNQWTVLSAALECVEKEIKLDMRTTIVRLENVLTRDKVAIDLDMKVFYSVDVREVHADRMIQVLRFESESAWEEIVKTGITDIARNAVVISHTFDDLATPAGRSYLKRALSSELAHRVRGFGILMNKFAVSIMNLQPNETFQQALQEGSAARAIGNAAADRLRPILEQFKDQDQQKAVRALLMQIASAVAKNGQSPDLFFPSSDDFPSNGGLSGSRHSSLEQHIPGVSPSRKPKSVAGD
jgi:regulator of protease activity HflC (stomatin/prohibitin superfamily)